MITVLRPATIGDFIAFYAHATIPSYVAWHAGERVAMGGLFERNGRTWGYFDIRDSVPAAAGLSIMRSLMRNLRKCDRDVSITCDEQVYPSAPRVLAALGFEQTEETQNGMRIWICRASKS